MPEVCPPDASTQDAATSYADAANDGQVDSEMNSGPPSCRLGGQGMTQWRRSDERGRPKYGELLSPRQVRRDRRPIPSIRERLEPRGRMAAARSPTSMARNALFKRSRRWSSWAP